MINNLIPACILFFIAALMYFIIALYLDRQYELLRKYLKSKDEYYDYLKWKDER